MNIISMPNCFQSGTRILLSTDQGHAERQKFVEKLILFSSSSIHLFPGKMKVGLKHSSDLYHNSFENILKNSISSDRAAQHSTVGIHKDDLIFNIGRSLH